MNVGQKTSGGTLAQSLAKLKEPSSRRAFPVPTRIHAVKRKHEAQKRAVARITRAFIRPENAARVIDAIPRAQGDRMHAVVAGDFVFGDLLLGIAERYPGAALSVSTLSLSLRNVEAIVRALDAEHVKRFELILSHYFQSTSRELYAALEKSLAGRSDCRVTIARTHTKVALFAWDDGRPPLVIESSANLRSSGNLEQVTAFAEPELYDFHRGIFTELFQIAG